jgi:hypothetical protein
MRERIRTLLVHSTGFRWQATVFGTALGVIGLRPGGALPFGLDRTRLLGRVFPYGALSYVNDWKEAVEASPALDVTACDTMNLVECVRVLRKIREYDLILVMHSAAGDTMRELRLLSPFFHRRQGRMAVFLGNEYDILEEKIRFINDTGAEFLCTQLPMEAARFLYADCPGASTLPMPHALNPAAYRDQGRVRDIDIGFRGALYHTTVGDMERTRLIRLFEEEGRARWGLNCSIQYGTVSRAEWAAFLNRCKGIAGAESGTYFLDRRGETLGRVKALLARKPDASMEEILPLFAQAKDIVSGKAVSSRHFEPVGTKTCQLLVEGEYNGIFTRDEHYIGVNKDFSDIDLAVEKFKEESFRNRIAEQAYAWVMENHTYARRVTDLVKRTGAARRGE